MLESYIILSILILLIYFKTIRTYSVHWENKPPFQIDTDFSPSVKISVVIAARNEAQNIIDCLKALDKIIYPKELMEIILINDHSEDNTVSKIQQFIEDKTNFVFLNLEQDKYGKKAAISKGIHYAGGDLILVTDADCIVKEYWLYLVAQFYHQYPFKMLAMPVLMYGENKLFHAFQSLDLMAMMAVTNAGIESKKIYMANGANLAYPKAAFLAVNGFEGIDHLASGDDMLLMEKIAKRFPGEIHFMKSIEASTFTKPLNNIGLFFDQRMRWATKSNSIKSPMTKFTLFIVYLLILSMLIDLIISPFSIFIFVLLCLKITAKIIVDYKFLKKLAFDLDKLNLVKKIIPAFFLHALYIVIIGSLSLFKKRYLWKGRTLK